MSEDTNQPKSPLRLSRGLRTAAFVILAGMVLLAIVAQFTTPEQLTAEEAIEATVQAGVDARLTESVALTGTPDATQIQSTVDVSIDATLTQIAIDTAPTPQPTPPPDGIEGVVYGVWNFIAGIALSIWGFFVGIWNFFGRAGRWAQVLCCIIPIAAIILGIVND